MNDDRLSSLIDAWRDGALTDAQAAELSGLLRASAEARAAFLDEAEWHGLLHGAAAGAAAGAALRQAEASGGRPAPAASLRRFAWLSWRTLALATAGVALGMFCTSVVWGLASPRMMATSARLFALLDGGFEEGTGKLPSGFPKVTGVWSGDESEIVSEGSQKAKEGRQMLRFLRAEGDATVPGSPADSCDVFQLVDLRPLRGQVPEGSESVLELSADFRDARAKPGPLVRFGCHLYLFEGAPGDLASVWPTTLPDALGSGVGLSLTRGGPGANAWRTVTARCVLPAQADFAVVQIGCGRVPRLSKGPPTLGEQFADNIRLTLRTQPKLPVKIVQP